MVVSHWDVRPVRVPLRSARAADIGVGLANEDLAQKGRRDGGVFIDEEVCDGADAEALRLVGAG